MGHAASPAAALALLLLSAAPAVAGVEEVHAPSVVDVAHAPSLPGRGEPVSVKIRLAEDAQAESVVLTYCRVQNYACAAPLAMASTGEHTYEGVIPWRDAFFHDVRDVGYAILVHLANGSVEHSPTAHWPAAPADLPDVDTAYYFYPLPPEPARVPDHAWTSVAALALSALLVAWGRRA